MENFITKNFLLTTGENKIILLHYLNVNWCYIMLSSNKLETV